MKSLLFLIGYRGTGKTTVGELLAERIGWNFVDADVHLEAKFGKTIKEIFAVDGEASFRDKETLVVRELCNRERCVVGTGGGIVLRDENRALLREMGYAVWLKASVPTIAARIQADPTTAARRPNLAGGGISEIEEMLRIRESLYRSCANLEIDTEGQSPQSIVETILNAWHSSGSMYSGSRSSSASGPASAAC
jgi:shikimate kinase